MSLNITNYISFASLFLFVNFNSMTDILYNERNSSTDSFGLNAVKIVSIAYKLLLM